MSLCGLHREQTQCPGWTEPLEGQPRPALLVPSAVLTSGTWVKAPFPGSTLATDPQIVRLPWPLTAHLARPLGLPPCRPFPSPNPSPAPRPGRPRPACPEGPRRSQPALPSPLSARAPPGVGARGWRGAPPRDAFPIAGNLGPTGRALHAPGARVVHARSPRDLASANWRARIWGAKRGPASSCGGRAAG